MHVVQLEIENFRGIRKATIPLTKHTVMLGPNNVGKTAVIEALSLLLGRERLSRTLGDYDFHGGRPAPADRVRLRATISGFHSDEPGDYPQWFNERAASSPIWWDGSNSKVEARPQEGRALAFQIGFAARFDADDLEVETLRYFVDGEAGDPFEEPNLVTVKAAHLTELGFFLLPASRTWGRVVSFGSELFRKVLRFQDAIPGEAITRLRDWLRAPSERIEEVEPLKALVARVNAELAAFVGRDAAGLTFRPTTGDIEGVLAALTPHLLGKGIDVALPIERHGSGVVSLQTLLLLMEFGRARRDKNQNFMLAAEEPELHLHPGHHRHLVARLRSVSDQTVVTTHSPEIAAYFRPEEILLLRTTNAGDVTAHRFASSLTSENAVMRLFTVYRGDLCAALMYRVVVVPEGLTEFRWFNGLMRACSGAAEHEAPEDGSAQEPTPLGFGVVPTQDAKVVRTHEVLRTAAPVVMPLVDGDSAGDRYRDELLEKGAERVLQLARGSMIETLIAEFVCATPLNDEQWATLESALGEALPARTEVALAAYLLSMKQKWDMHEAVIGWIAEHPPAYEAARRFLQAVTVLPRLGSRLARWVPDAAEPRLLRWTRDSAG